MPAWITIGASLALVAACGGEGSAATSCTAKAGADPPAPSVTAGQLTATADRSRVSGLNAVVTFTVTAAGPLHYQAPCTGPLELVVADSADLHVYAASPSVASGPHCGAAVTLAPTEQAAFQVRWQPDTTLPAGSYRALLTLGDQPALVLTVLLGPADCSSAG